MPRPSPNAPDVASAPSLPLRKKAEKGRKLVIAMVLFTVSILAIGLVVWLLSQAFGPGDAPDLSEADKMAVDLAQVNPPATTPLDGVQSDAEPRLSADAKPVIPAAPTAPAAPKLQGPEAGQIVAPPSRNVTPNFQLSPLHQTKPLTRAVGKALPPPPKLPPLPKIFRKVGILGPNRLVLMTRLRSQSVSLSHVRVPDPKTLCHLGEQKIACYKMGKTALSRFIRGRAIGCLDLKDSRNSRSEPQVAQCFLGTGLTKRLTGDAEARVTDLAAWMVRYGWLVPDADHYQAELAEAKRMKRGLYAPEPSGEALQALRQKQAEREALMLDIETELAGTIKPGDQQTVDDEALSLFSGDALTPDQVPPRVLP